MEHSIIFSAKNLGAEIKVVNGGSIFCNWFEDCGQVDSNAVLDVGVILLQDCQNMDISRNNFLTSWYACNVFGGVRPTVNIHHNSFDRMNRILEVRFGSHQGPSNPVFQENCMWAVDNFNVFINPNSGTDPLDARFNFWNTNSEQEVYDYMIHDCQDDPLCACVDISPIHSECPAGVGICTQ